MPDLSTYRSEDGEAGGKKPLASPSLVSQWTRQLKERRSIVDLPSGLQVEVDRLPLSLMWARGMVPDALTARVQEFIAAIETKNGEAAKDAITSSVDGLSEEELADRYFSWVQLLDFIWVTTVRSPEFVNDRSGEDIDSGVIWVGDVDYFDKLYLFQYTQGVDQTVEDFFREQGEALGTLSDGEGLRNTSERILRAV